MRKQLTITVGADSRGYTDLRGISAYCQWGPRTTRSYMTEHNFPFFKLPTGTIRFSYSEVDEWLGQFHGKSKVDLIVAKIKAK